MSKKPFIQTAATVFLPATGWNLDQAIRYAEALWQRLSERGYGAAEKRGPREVAEDALSKLSPGQRKQFDRFWAAFAHKAGKQRAAMRWGQLAPDAALAERIIDAARQEAQRQRQPGEVRKMAEGWLSERRWEDYAPKGASPQPEADRARKMNSLRAEIESLGTLCNRATGAALESLEAQRNRKRAELAQLMEADHAPG